MPNNKENQIDLIEGALAGGLIGAALGALITGKTKGAIISAIAGAAIGASWKAFQESKKLDIPFLFEKDGIIYKQMPNGDIVKVKELEKSTTEIPRNFSLE